MCLATALFHLLRAPSKSSTKPLRIARFRTLLLPALLTALLLALIAVLLAVPTPAALHTPRFGALPPAGMPRCLRGLVFTGARQGSTWFLDSLERCTYSSRTSRGGRLFADDVFRRTELWKHFGEPHLDGTALDASGALRYIAANTSVKVFPSVFWRRRDDVEEMVRRAHEFGVAVLVLRREVGAAWESWRRANASAVWNGKGGENAGWWNETQYQYFVDSRGRYDRGVEELLGRTGVVFDVFDYEEARKEAVIVARKNGCYIRNCNFVGTLAEGEGESERERESERGGVRAAHEESKEVQLGAVDEASAGEDVRDGPD